MMLITPSKEELALRGLPPSHLDGGVRISFRLLSSTC